MIDFFVSAPSHPDLLICLISSLSQTTLRIVVTNEAKVFTGIQSYVDSMELIMYVPGLDPSAVALTQIFIAPGACASATYAPD